LDPVVLGSIRDLEFVARVIVGGTVSGLHRSPFHGYSAEFSQYRHYRPGDDLKYVDWKLFARTDRLYTKQFRETTNLQAQIVVDASASMAYRGSRGAAKIDCARLTAAALSSLIAGQGDAVGLVVFDDAVRALLPSRAGRGHLRRLLVALSQVAPNGGGSAAHALRRAADLLKTRGLLVFFSDLYDEDAALERELRRAVRIGHEVVVFHVLTRDELEFPFASDIEVEDAETGRRVLTGAAAAAAYRNDVNAFLDRWRSRCLQSGMEYVRLITDAPLDAALRRYLIGRTGSVRR